VAARRALDLTRPDDEEKFADLADEEEPPPPPFDVSHARPAKLCECDELIGHEGRCILRGTRCPLLVQAVAGSSPVAHLKKSLPTRGFSSLADACCA